MQLYAIICNYMQLYAAICRNYMQLYVYAVICSYMQLYAVMHGSMSHTKLKIFTACIDTSAASPSSQVRPASRHVGTTSHRPG